MGLFSKKKNAIGEAERKRLWDGLAEFLRLNFRPNDTANAAAGAAPGDLGWGAGLTGGGMAAATCGRNVAASSFMMNAMMPSAMAMTSPVAMMREDAKAEETAVVAEEEAAETAVEEAAEFDAELLTDNAEESYEAEAELPDADEDAAHSIPVSPATLEYRGRKQGLTSLRKKSVRRENACYSVAAEKKDVADIAAGSAMEDRAPEIVGKSSKKRSLTDVVAQVGETWQQSLLRKIDEKGFSDSEVYKRAGVDRKLFSKIRCNEAYQPKKSTAVAFALALQLTLDETRDMLARAGYALSPSSRFDLIVEFFIENDVFDIDTINEALYDHGEALLGA